MRTRKPGVVAKRMGATIHVSASHVPMLAKPDAGLGVVRDAANAVASARVAA